MLESKIQKDILAYLTKNRIYHFRFQAQSNLNGLPDIICLYKGLFIGLELKREEGGKPTELQLRKIKAINDNGGIGVIIRSVKEVKLLFDIIGGLNIDIYEENSFIARSNYVVIKDRNEKK